MRRDGYTLIEVLTAVVVMTIGATGILAMQGASVRSNQDARETSVAINFASTWIERLKRDGRRWTSNGSSALVNTSWLINAVNENAGRWFVPATTAPESIGADHFGFDVPNPANLARDARFCVNVALTVAHAYNPVTRTSTVTSDADVIRADVRVWWHRGTPDANRARACNTTPLSAEELASPAIRKAYLSTSIMWREPGWP